MSRTIRPQRGPQEKFLATSADIAIYGGAAGGGKTYGLLMEPLRYMNVDGYRAVIFRQSYTQIYVSGGLWEESQMLYNGIKGAVGTKSPKYNWSFNNKAKVYFDYLTRDEDVMKWQGSQITFIGFDELTHFSKKQFIYMMSRNRSTCGVRPYIRGTCNPDADSWVAKLIAWWIDPETGYPIPERSGIIRYMATLNDDFVFADNRDELIEAGAKPQQIKTITFISSKLTDNKALMEKDPSYLSNLMTLTLVDRERLLNGNWKIKPAAGAYFQRKQVEVILDAPNDIYFYCRAWDLAATGKDEEGNPDYTAGVLMGVRRNGLCVVLDVINVQYKAADVDRLLKSTAASDRKRYGYNYEVHIPQDPGQAGKRQAQYYIKLFSGYDIRTDTISGSKEVRATPYAAQWQAGNVQIVAGEWNDMYFNQLEMFPEGEHDDMVDASSDAFTELMNHGYNIESLL